MKTKLIKFHFIILLLLVANFIITNAFNFGLNSYAKITLIVLLFGSGVSIFTLNFKQLFKPFTLLKAYSTFYITILLLTLFVWNNDGYWSSSVLYRFEKTLSTDKLVYEQSNYEIYVQPSMLDFLNVGCFSTASSDYYINKNYFIFKTRIGYFSTTYFAKYTNQENPLEFEISETYKDLGREKIKNIKIEKDSIFIDFKDNSTRSFELY